MKTIGSNFKKVLFKNLSLDRYLTVVSRSYFLLYRLRIIKNSTSFKYHYFLKSVINKNDVVLDIGANLGYFTIPFSRWVGKEGMVYAVEPIQQMRAVLQKHIGKRKNIKVFPYALGTENKNIRMGNNTRQDQGVIETGSHFVLEENGNAIDEFTAEMKKGSELFSDLERLDFIKCDVEGYETIIIPEIKNILIEHTPIMLVETRSDNRVFLLDFLSSIGYQGYVLDNKKLYPAGEIKEKAEDDVLFIHEDKIGRFSDVITSKSTRSFS